MRTAEVRWRLMAGTGWSVRHVLLTQLREVVLAHIAANQDKIEPLVSQITYTEQPPYLSDWGNVLDNKLPERIPAIAWPPRKYLANEIEWSSKERGDGLGFDVRSFRVDVRTDRVEEHFIEVKTTNNGKYQPFYVTPNELDFSRDSAENYSLYRVFELKNRGRIFRLPGAIDQHVCLQPELYKASFLQS